MSILPINTIDETQLLSFLRQFLWDQGIGRDPRDGTQKGVQPPIWLEPRRGVPYPGQKQDLADSEQDPSAVMALEYATEIPSQPYEGFVSKPHVIIWFRTAVAPTGFQLYKRVKDVLHDQRNYSLHGLQVLESMLFRALQPLGTDSSGFTFNCEFEFEVWSY